MASVPLLERIRTDRSEIRHALEGNCALHGYQQLSMPCSTRPKSAQGRRTPIGPANRRVSESALSGGDEHDRCVDYRRPRAW